MTDDHSWIDVAEEICDAEVKSGIRRFCPKCGEELRLGSISYFEGFHIDSCE